MAVGVQRKQHEFAAEQVLPLEQAACAFLPHKPNVGRQALTDNRHEPASVDGLQRNTALAPVMHLEAGAARPGWGGACRRTVQNPMRTGPLNAATELQRRFSDGSTAQHRLRAVPMITLHHSMEGDTRCPRTLRKATFRSALGQSASNLLERQSGTPPLFTWRFIKSRRLVGPYVAKLGFACAR